VLYHGHGAQSNAHGGGTFIELIGSCEEQTRVGLGQLILFFKGQNYSSGRDVKKLLNAYFVPRLFEIVIVKVRGT
jgi:hypothetical protein